MMSILVRQKGQTHREGGRVKVGTHRRDAAAPSTRQEPAEAARSGEGCSLSVWSERGVAGIRVWASGARTASEYISVIVSCAVAGDLWQPPRGTNTLC